jgi:anti-anti-sigma factor
MIVMPTNPGSLNCKINEDKTSVSVEGYLGYSSYKNLKDILLNVRHSIKELDIDLREMPTMSSTDFGVLLSLRHMFEGECLDITLLHPNQNVASVLRLFHAHKLFNIVE